MSKELPRREALRHLAVLSVSAFLPAALVGCSKKTSCLDVSGLSADEVATRNGAAAYVESTPDPAKACAKCVQYVAAAPDACGSCKVVKGPINPNGSCRLFAAKPA